MAKKEYAEKNHEHPWLSNGTLFSVVVGIALLFMVVVLPGNVAERLDSLEKEIASMPHYECWNATLSQWKNLSEVSCAAQILENGSLRTWCEEFISEPFRNYKVECFKDAGKCYIEEIKEVCEIVRPDASLGVNE